jgi:hypothetical protein
VLQLQQLQNFSRHQQMMMMIDSMLHMATHEFAIAKLKIWLEENQCLGSHCATSIPSYTWPARGSCSFAEAGGDKAWQEPCVSKLKRWSETTHGSLSICHKVIDQ